MGKYRKIGTKNLDPRKVTIHRTVHSEKAVQGYMKDPNWRGPDFFGNGGTPLVVLRDDGTYAANIGNHRIEAAARTGRKIKCQIYVEKGSKSDPGRLFSW